MPILDPSVSGTGRSSGPASAAAILVRARQVSKTLTAIRPAGSLNLTLNNVAGIEVGFYLARLGGNNVDIHRVTAIDEINNVVTLATALNANAPNGTVMLFVPIAGAGGYQALPDRTYKEIAVYAVWELLRVDTGTSYGTGFSHGKYFSGGAAYWKTQNSVNSWEEGLDLAEAAASYNVGEIHRNTNPREAWFLRYVLADQRITVVEEDPAQSLRTSRPIVKEILVFGVS